MDEVLREDRSCPFLWHWFYPVFPADNMLSVTVKTKAEDPFPVVGHSPGGVLRAGMPDAAGRHGPWQSVTAAGAFDADPVSGYAHWLLHRASVMGIFETGTLADADAVLFYLPARCR